MGSERGDDAELAAAPPTADSLEREVFAARLEARLLGGEPDLPRVDRFVLERMLGAGGMGTVWLARDEALGRRVALKLVRGGGAAAGERMRLREARGLARITHPNVIGVHDVGEHEGRVWLAMEYVPGRTLRECAGELARGEALRHWIAAGRGLAAIHAAGFVHRDVKPDNVLLGDDGRVRIIDLGLVREAVARATVQIAGADRTPEILATIGFVGTRAYAAPEQLRGEPVDARADQYAYAVSVLESLHAARSQSGRAHEPLPAAMLAVLERGRHADPAQRFDDMSEFVGTLAGIGEVPDVGGPRPGLATTVSLGTTREGAPSMSGAADASAMPRRIGHYEVLCELGRGGMGVVYAAHDTRLDRKVAVKRLLGGRDGRHSRLYREALAMAKLSHPNVIPIYEIVEDRDSTCIVMEFVEGQTLREWLATPRPRGEVLAAYKAAARGLIAAHQKQLVHRDFKPDNVMLGDDGRVRVMDFGLASVAQAVPRREDDGGATRESASDLTQPGTVMGTPAYMSPEQFRAEPASVASDVFSFCAALYEGLFGERPFAGRSPAELRESVTGGQLREAPADSSVPAWLRALVCRGLAVRPEDRFESMQALLDAIVAGELAEQTEPREPPAYVFVAHEGRDTQAVLRLCERLIDHGVRPWLDLWELGPGADRRTAEEQALLAAPAVIVCGDAGYAGALAARIERDRATVFAARLPGAGAITLDVEAVVLDEGRWEEGVLELARRIGIDLRRERWLADEAARVGVEARALSPYRGLAAFREQDARWMFGREDEVAALIDLIRAGQTRFVTLIGASGSGKSSLLMGGVCPMLRCGVLGDGVAWSIATLRPGPRPCEALAHALVHLEASGDAGEDAARISRLRAELRDDRDALRLTLGRAAARGRTLLVIDQFEELFTEAGLGGPDGGEALAFVRNLLEATQELAGLDGKVWIAATLRADFVQRALEVPELARALQVGTYFALPPMREAQIRAAIERPAARVGYRVESTVVDRLVAAAAHQAGRLPLLQHVLRELWARRDEPRRTLGEAAYAETGGIEGAIAVAAERALRGIGERLGADGELATRRLMTRLVHLGGRSSEDTRRRVTLAGLGDDAATREVLEALVREARVLVATEVDGVETVEIAHEALLREWTTLVRWLDADREALRLRQELAEDAKRGISNEYLWGRGRVEEARRVLGASTVLLDAREREFLTASERAVRRRRRWVQSAVAALLATAAVVVAVVSEQRAEAVRERDRADDERNRADDQAQKADANAADARAQKAAAERERDRTRDAAWMAYARERRVADPTRALLGLRNVRARDVEGWLDDALYVLHEPIAVAEWIGRWPAISPDGTRIVSIAEDDRSAEVRNIDGSGEPVVLKGHEGEILSVTFSPDGQAVVTASMDQTARLWNADGSGETTILRGHTAWVYSATFSPDGRHLITDSNDRTVRVWKVGSGESIALFHSELLYGPPSDLSVDGRHISADGRRIIVGVSNKVASVRNLDGSGKPVMLRGHQDGIRSAEFSPDGRRVVTASFDGTVRVWAADGSRAPFVLGGPQTRARTASFDRAGQRIVSGSEDGSVRVWNADGRGDPIVLKGHEAWIHSAKFSFDGSRIITASADSTVRLWDPHGSAQPVVFRGHEGEVVSVSFSRDGRYLVTFGNPGTVRVWKVDAPGQPVLRGHKPHVHSVNFSPDGLRVVTASDDATARVWHADGSGQPVVLKGHESGVNVARFSPDGRRVVTASDDRTARVWKSDGSGEPLVLGGHEEEVRSANFSSDGRRVVTQSGSVARVWDIEDTGARVVVLGHESGLWWANFNPDGRRIATVSGDGTVRVWSIDGSGDPEVLPGSPDSFGASASWSPDGQRIAVASANGAILVWSTDRLGEPLVLKSGFYSGLWSLGGNLPQSVDFGSDGRHIAQASKHVGLIWDIEDPGEPVRLTGHAGHIYTVTFSHDGRRVVTAASDDTARVWNADGSAYVVLRGHRDKLTAATFSPDGQRVATASVDGTARVWDLDPSVVRAQLEAATTLCVPYKDRVQYAGETKEEACAAFIACEREHGRGSAGGVDRRSCD